MGLTKDSIMNDFEEVEQVLKAQIVGGPNSGVKSWAGSVPSDEDFPNTTPNGTDWDPKPGDRTPHKASNRGGGGKTRKSVKDFSDSDLRRELQFRKSGAPNPTQADYEIMKTVPDVVKAVCTNCEGNALHKGWYCNSCNNLGTIYQIKTEQAGELIKSIQHKWNIHKIDEDYWKSQNVNTGGGVDEADTTSKNKSNMREEKEDHTGEMVAKGNDLAAEMEDMADKISGDKDDDDDEYDDMEEDVDKCKKGIEQCLKGIAFIARRQTAMLKGAYLTAGMSKSIGVQVAEMGEDVEWLVRSMQTMQENGVDINKSMNTQQVQNNGPARGPQAFGPGVQLQVINKSFSDQAPGRGLPQTEGGMPPGQNVPGNGNPNGLEHDYDIQTLKKAATYLAINKKMNRRDALSLDTGLWPTEKVEKSLVGFLNNNNGVVPPLGG